MITPNGRTHEDRGRRRKRLPGRPRRRRADPAGHRDGSGRPRRRPPPRGRRGWKSLTRNDASPVGTTTAPTIDGGGPSRGSLRSVLETVETFKDGGLVWEDGDWRAGTPARRTAITFPGHSEAT